MDNKTVLLFSYGTLQLESVQLATYGRILTGEKDRLSAYKLEKVKITDDEVLKKSGVDHHPIAVEGGPSDFVPGVLFEITEAELAETDKYEVDDYQRLLKTFDSGKKGWIYVAK